MVLQVFTYVTLPRHRHGLARAEVGSAQRARILNAAAETVAARGYGKATVTEITRRAGVSTKTFYELFDGKEAAFLAVYDDLDVLIETAQPTAGQGTGTGDEPRVRLHAALDAALEMLAAAPHLTRMLAMEAVGGGPVILARRNASFRRLAALVADLLDRPPTDLLVTAYLGGLAELVVQHLTGALPDPAPEIHRFTDALFFPTEAR
ncbi:hypothetical protein GCM10022221_64090 [Actinocorallia aurea]